MHSNLEWWKAAHWMPGAEGLEGVEETQEGLGNPSAKTYLKSTPVIWLFHK